MIHDWSLVSTSMLQNNPHVTKFLELLNSEYMKMFEELSSSECSPLARSGFVVSVTFYVICQSVHSSVQCITTFDSKWPRWGHLGQLFLEGSMRSPGWACHSSTRIWSIGSDWLVGCSPLSAGSVKKGDPLYSLHWLHHCCTAWAPHWAPIVTRSW